MPTRLHYLGPTGTFTEQAARLLAARTGVDVELVATGSIPEAFSAIRRNPLEQAVVPYYNFLEGLVQESIDGLFETHARVTAAQRLPIVLAIGKHPGSQPVEVVYSHPKALAQVSNYLAREMPSVRCEPVPSTADAARRAAQTPGSAAVAREAALRDAGLLILHHDVGNRTAGRANYTEFLHISGGQPLPDQQAPWRTMVAIAPYEERVGLLADILNQFAFYRINLAKIHSRPSLLGVNTSLDPQMFYFEAVCRDDEPDFQACRSAINHRFAHPSQPEPMVSLGSYPLFDPPEDSTDQDR